MGFWKEVGNLAKGFAEDYVSERGVKGTLDDLSNLGSKLFGSNNSNNYINSNNINEEWNKTRNEISSNLDNDKYPQAYDLLNSFYESYNLNKDLEYYYITYWTIIRWLESRNTDGYDESMLISIAENAIASASDFSCDSDQKRDIREADSRLQAIIKSKQELDAWNAMYEKYEKYLEEGMYNKAHDVLEKHYNKYEKDYFYYRDKLKIWDLKLVENNNTIIDSNTESKIENLIKTGIEKAFDDNSKSWIENLKQDILYRILVSKLDSLTQNGEFDEADNLVEMYRGIKGLSAYFYRSSKRLVIQRKWRATSVTDPNCAELEKEVLNSFDVWRRVCKTDYEKESLENCFNEVYPTIKAEKEVELKTVKSDSNSQLSISETEYLAEYKECVGEDGEITEKERRLLDKLANSLGISIERVKELENLSSKTALSDTEREYLDEYKECISEDGQISDKERRLLDKFAQSLGLDNETIKRLENSVKA